MTEAAFDDWIACRKPNPRARLRLFCFPYAGAGASIFRAWPEGLPTDVEVCPVQLPGRATRLMETPFTRLAPLVEALAQALAPLFDRKFAFFGHSMGALIGFELARRLRKSSGARPMRLFVSGARAPQLPPRDRPIHALPEPEFLAELRRFNGTADAALESPELMQIVLPILRADFAVCETYAYAAEPPLDCPISGFGGSDDHSVRSGDLEAWRDQTSAAFTPLVFPGDHFFLNASEPLLLQVLSGELGRDK